MRIHPPYSAVSLALSLAFIAYLLMLVGLQAKQINQLEVRVRTMENGEAIHWRSPTLNKKCEPKAGLSL